VPKYIIERIIPDASQLSEDELRAFARKSCAVISDMGPEIQWVESCVTEDRIYCKYIAPDPNTLREHARRGGFPADHISEIKAIIDPTTGGK
jgi:hypothetical protein